MLFIDSVEDQTEEPTDGIATISVSNRPGRIDADLSEQTQAEPRLDNWWGNIPYHQFMYPVLP